MASFNKDFVEFINISGAITPIDLTTGANAGDWVSLNGYSGVAVVIYSSDAGTAGDDIDITMEQATDVAGTDNKALNFTRIWDKTGATIPAGTYTLTTQAASNTYTDIDSAENAWIGVIDIKVDDLDVDGGFCCVQLAIADTGTPAHLGCALYMLYGPKVAQATLVDALVD